MGFSPWLVLEYRDAVVQGWRNLKDCTCLTVCAGGLLSAVRCDGLLKCLTFPDIQIGKVSLRTMEIHPPTCVNVS